jgi:succinate dehydrogenase/fumarate reductase flavoprotein subunit
LIAAGGSWNDREGGHSASKHLRATVNMRSWRRSLGVASTPGIERYTGAVAIDPLTLSHNDNPEDRYAPLTCFGAYALLGGSEEPVAIVARKTVLACGGLGQIFQHSPPSRRLRRGHGRVGAPDRPQYAVPPDRVYGKNATLPDHRGARRRCQRAW